MVAKIDRVSCNHWTKIFFAKHRFRSSARNASRPADAEREYAKPISSLTMRMDTGSVIPSINRSAFDRCIPSVRANSVAVEASLIARQYDGRSLNVCASEGAEVAAYRRTVANDKRTM